MSGDRGKDGEPVLDDALARDPRSRVREEIEFHLETQVAELIAAGWSVEEARAEARRRFGDASAIESALVRRAQRRARRMRWGAVVDEARAHVAFAVRQIRRRPGFAAAAVGLLAVGVGLGAATLGVVDAALLRPLPFSEPEQLVYLYAHLDDRDTYPASLPELRDWAEGASFLSSVAGIASTSLVLAGDAPTEINGAWIWGDWIGVVGLPPVAGRGWTPEERTTRAPAVLLDEEAWRERWGADPAVVGSTLVLDDEPYDVLGVIPSEARLLAGRPEAVLWMIMPELEVMDRGLRFLRVAGRLAPGVGMDEAREQAEALGARLRDEGITTDGLELSPARERILGDTRQAVGVLGAAALLVLLVVCANLTILFAARTQERLREFAVRGALGAASGRIARQVLTEALVLGMLAGALGTLAGRTLTGVLASTRPGALEVVVRGGDLRTIGFAAGLALLSAIAVGWGPARSATGVAPGPLLVGKNAGTRGALRGRRLLIGLEVALSVVLLTSAGLLLRSVERLLTVDPGFEPTGAMTAWVIVPGLRYPPGPERVRLWDDFLERVRALPGVESAGGIDEIPLGGSSTNGGFEIVGHDFPENDRPSAKKRFTGPGALEALGVPLLRGRFFTEADGLGAPEVALISRSVAERFWPREDPVGQRIRFLWRTEAEQEIVGVVEDVRSDALDVAEGGTIYVSYRQLPAGASGLSIVVRTSGAPMSLVEPMRRTLQEVDPTLPLTNPRALEELVTRSVADRTRITGLLSAFAAVALALAALGLYAVTARSVGRRTREIGIRKAMGAGGASIVGMVVREEAPAVAIGLALGIALSLPAGRALGALLYATEVGDPATLGAVTVTLAAAALAALLLPAWRAARIPPATAVRDGA